MSEPEPQITREEMEGLLQFFTPDQVRLMAERWSQITEELKLWLIIHGEGNGDSIHFFRPKER